MIATKDTDNIDCACGSRLIKPLSLFISRLNIYTGTSVSPFVEGVEHKAIPINGGNDEGYAVTLVPPSNSGPHMALTKEQRYYKRCGDSFYKMEHFDIADMFGRRKRPILMLRGKLNKPSTFRQTGKPGIFYKSLISIVIENTGRGSALYPYVEIESLSPYKLSGGSSSLPSRRHSIFDYCFGASPDYIIHPGMEILIGQVKIEFASSAQSSVKDIDFQYNIAAEDMPMRTNQHFLFKDIVDEIMNYTENLV